jgi:hypothetical protein
LAGGPIIHVAHSRGDIAGASVALRLGLGASGAVVGALAEHCSSGSSSDIPCGYTGGVFGMFAGAIVASVIDFTALAREPREPRPETGVSVTPILSADRHSGTVGLAGAF